MLLMIADNKIIINVMFLNQSDLKIKPATPS